MSEKPEKCITDGEMETDVAKKIVKEFTDASQSSSEYYDVASRTKVSMP